MIDDHCDYCSARHVGMVICASCNIRVHTCDPCYYEYTRVCIGCRGHVCRDCVAQPQKYNKRTRAHTVCRQIHFFMRKIESQTRKLRTMENLAQVYIHILEAELIHAQETIQRVCEDLDRSHNTWMQDCAYCGRPTVFGTGKTGRRTGVNDFTCTARDCENMYCRECIHVAADFRVDPRTLYIEGECHIHRNAKI